MLNWLQSLGVRFLGLIALGVVLFVASPIYLHLSSCKPNGPQWPIETAAQPYSEEHATQQTQYATPSAEEEQADAAYGSARPEKESISWFCDYRLGDIGLVFFTYCLVIVGWVAVRSADQNTHTIERALIFLAVENELVAGIAWKCKLAASNSGRTPGIIAEFYFRFTDTEPSGEPSYPHTEMFFAAEPDILAPAGNKAILLDASLDITKTPFVYGFIRYRDIFLSTHTTRFVLQYDAKLNGMRRGGTDAWNSWD